MSWGLVGAVLERHADLPHVQWRLLVVLAHHAYPESREASPGIETIKRETGLSGSSIKRATRALRAAALISVKPPGPGRATVYTLTDEPVTSNGDHTGGPHSEPRNGTGASEMAPDGSYGGQWDGPRSESSNGGQISATGATAVTPTGASDLAPPTEQVLPTGHPGARARVAPVDEDDQEPITGRVLPPGTSLTQTDQRRADVIAAVQSAVKARTGKALDDDEAETLAHSLLGSRSVRDPASYLGKVIRDEAKPGRLLPPRLSGTPQPQQWHARPRRPDQGDINERGGTLARQLLQARPGARTGPREDTHGRRPNEDTQAWALRQVGEARAARGEPPRTAGAAEDPLPDW